MRVRVLLSGVVLAAATIAGLSCGRSPAVVSPDNAAQGAAAELPGAVQASRASTGGKIWADCSLFGTVGTPAHFKPGSGHFDELYNIEPAGGKFKDGVTAISESKPGDRDYNGGRWHVNLLKEGVDPAKYLDACSVDDLDLSDFTGTDTYFECPLLPKFGQH